MAVIDANLECLFGEKGGSRDGEASTALSSSQSQRTSFLGVDDAAAGASETPSPASSPQRLLGHGPRPPSAAFDDLGSSEMPMEDVTQGAAMNDEAQAGVPSGACDDAGEDAILREIDAALSVRLSPEVSGDVGDDDFSNFCAASDEPPDGEIPDLAAAEAAESPTWATFAAADDDDFGDFPSLPPPLPSVSDASLDIANDSAPPDINNATNQVAESHAVPASTSSSFAALKGRLKPDEINWDDDDDDVGFRFDANFDTEEAPAFDGNPFKAVDDDDEDDFADFEAAHCDLEQTRIEA